MLFGMEVTCMFLVFECVLTMAWVSFIPQGGLLQRFSIALSRAILNSMCE